MAISDEVIRNLHSRVGGIFSSDSFKMSTRTYDLLLMLMLCYCLCRVSSNECPSVCHCNQDSMVCEKEVPTIIPSTVTRVTIYAVNFASYAMDPPFNSSAWSKVTDLTIDANQYENGTKITDHESFTMQPYTFLQLHNLKHLAFRNSAVQNMRPSSFAGLGQLKTLDFKGNVQLRINDFITGLRGHELFELESLRLSNISQSRGVANVFNASFFMLLSKTKLTFLDLSYIDSALMDTPSFASSLTLLEEIVFEHAGYLGINIFRANMDHSESAVYRTLRKININYSTIPPSIFEAAELLKDNSYIGYDAVPNNFTHVRARACVPESVPSNVFSINFTNCTRVAMEFPMVAVNWTIFCLPTHPNGGLYLELLDVADNGIEYFHPSLTGSATRLKYLDISLNRLYKMKQKEFGQLVHHCPDLQTLKLTHNQLTNIPPAMFSKSHQLEHLDLSNNKLTHVDFNTDNLNNLKHLDLSHNAIMSIENDMRVRLDNLITKYQTQTKRPSEQKISPKFQLRLEGNPLECSCETVEFEEWVIEVKDKSDLRDVQCEYKESVVPLTESVYEESLFECKLIIIYSVVGSVSGVIFVVVVIISVVCFRRWLKKYRKKKLESVIMKYKSSCGEGSAGRVPVFLSHAGADEEFVWSNILSGMNATLQRLIGTNETCVTTGDFSFRPGQYVADEIIRCIEEARVIVACVSVQFCKSHWCKNEIIVSQMENKPLVLLLLEHVQTDHMPKYLKKHFNTTTRCKVYKNDRGEIIMHPNMEIICESILKLMAKTE